MSRYTSTKHIVRAHNFFRMLVIDCLTSTTNARAKRKRSTKIRCNQSATMLLRRPSRKDIVWSLGVSSKAPSLSFRNVETWETAWELTPLHSPCHWLASSHDILLANYSCIQEILNAERICVRHHRLRISYMAEQTFLGFVWLEASRNENGGGCIEDRRGKENCHNTSCFIFSCRLWILITIGNTTRYTLLNGR